MTIVKASALNDKIDCPKCKRDETVYVRLDFKESDPIAPKYCCIGCRHEWDDFEDRL